jgi:hypothetical protein
VAPSDPQKQRAISNGRPTPDLASTKFTYSSTNINIYPTKVFFLSKKGFILPSLFN